MTVGGEGEEVGEGEGEAVEAGEGVGRGGVERAERDRDARSEPDERAERAGGKTGRDVDAARAATRLTESLATGRGTGARRAIATERAGPQGVREARETREGQEAQEAGEAGEARAVRVRRLVLGDRDRQLLAVVGEARCLSLQQLRRLFFRGRFESAARRRLAKLSGGEGPLLKVVRWYDRSGAKTAWALTPAGYAELEATMGHEVDVPRDDIGAEYLDHHVHLSELYVGLLAEPVERAARGLSSALAPREQRLALGRIYARAAHPAFRWRVVGERDLPWKQPVGAALQARLLRPDGILELPARGRRIFIEAELGAHTIVAVSASKTGATLAKAERYEAFCTLMCDAVSRRTWYARRFPDALRPEVLFLVRNDVRRASVERALEAWRRTHPRTACSFWVATVDGAVAALLPEVGLTRAAPGVGRAAGGERRPESGPESGSLSEDEVSALCDYFRMAQGELKARRDRARAAGLPPPPYPPTTEAVLRLLARLRGGVAPERTA